ncbi:uncharacterized protein VTP21DRAFT_684 [Calcarisporiella thermophila]|uniref:uncharacterized protein n=1 Tax=Calcarisporiella thermophila TaxID=911321 RepID=UPI0037428177
MSNPPPPDTSLNQADFRKLLETPRGDSGPRPTVLGKQLKRDAVPKTPRLGAPSFPKPEVPKFKPKQSSSKRKHPSSSTEGSDPPPPKYRDRAAERRRGYNPDYVETEKILETINQSASDNGEGLSAYEQSKYLGGDAAHTHLVKGLDYTLLQRMRGDLPKDQEDGEGEILDEELEKALDDKEVAQPKFKNSLEEMPELRSPFSQNIYNIAICPPKPLPKMNELFVQGRMAFVFELADEKGEHSQPFSIPTTLMRSKADLPEAAHMGVSADHLVIEKIANLFAELRSGKRKDKSNAVSEKIVEKNQKREEVNAPATMANDDDDEDIFAGVGRDYVYEPDGAEKDAAPDKEENNSEDNGLGEQNEEARNYFGDKPEESDAGAASEERESNEASMEVKDILAQVSSNPELTIDSTVAPSLKEKVRISELQPTSYEGYDAYGSDDSDEDGPRPNTLVDQGVHKNKRAQLSRWDFDNEEEWRAYKDSVEAIPKTAMQFGVKMADGRKTRRSIGTEADSRQKLERDWQRISRIMEKKYGGEEEGDENKKEAKRQKM